MHKLQRLVAEGQGLTVFDRLEGSIGYLQKIAKQLFGLWRRDEPGLGILFREPGDRSGMILLRVVGDDVVDSGNPFVAP